MTEKQVDLLVIGAGPAGMATALEAHRRGVDTLVLDENPYPGGQIYRNVSHSPLANPGVLGPDYLRGRALVDAFTRSGITYWPQTLAWQITPDKRASVTRQGPDGGTLQIAARAIALTGGAQERPFPVPGWTLPGVMGVGAAQTLLKAAALAPSAPAVLAGCGPLLYLFAWQLLQAGIEIRALLDTTAPGTYRTALPHLPGALRAPAYLAKGWKMLRAIRHAGVEHVKHVQSLALRGTHRVEAVEYEAAGRMHRLTTPLVLLHQGVIPNTQITRSVGCDHVWDEAQLCWRPQLDVWGETSVADIFVAGDGGGIAGALAAEVSGRLVGLQLAHRLVGLDSAERDAAASGPRAELARHLAIRPLLDALYRPADPFRRPPADDTIVCRCEEVTAGDIRAMAKLGCVGPNQTKSFSRCGMGPCQGRFCGLTVAELLAQAHGTTVPQAGYYRIRPPIKPITLGEVAMAVPADGGIERASFPK
ncbi:(2Fe-2S)-binding protein [Pandoraea thiooxydans]|uniref:FAD/NAD(P)-binding oxidoreductase n=1 Tax=Pandoraea thiooxydans TaxID=445709 RepID=A0A0G3ERW1_9BURK|nr:NAD(P)/FAD-dependent oxidoreductase [Pandoraea thiooxydans]AKJ68057.1 FAD/NAD(P)-binding oxidoreductase [Pandoraea thiooxydans]APR95307.1 (2Fe-2S)-binding protein [Pandoraea thiooxydans]